MFPSSPRAGYMRNWPVEYRELQAAGDGDMAAPSLLFVVAAGVTVIAILGPSRADQVSSVMSGVAALLTFLSYRRRDDPSAGTGGGLGAPTGSGPSGPATPGA